MALVEVTVPRKPGQVHQDVDVRSEPHDLDMINSE